METPQTYEDASDVAGWTPEEWRPIMGYPYEVSDLGHVRRSDTCREVAIRLKPSRGGVYVQVDLWRYNKRSTRRVHRLVAQSFIPNPLFKPEVNHKDNNPLNNNKANLEWSTRVENEAHKRFWESLDTIVDAGGKWSNS